MQLVEDTNIVRLLIKCLMSLEDGRIQLSSQEIDAARNEHRQMKARIAELEAEIQEYRCLCEDWALVETDESIKLAMIEASKPEVNNE